MTDHEIPNDIAEAIRNDEKVRFKALLLGRPTPSDNDKLKYCELAIEHNGLQIVSSLIDDSSCDDLKGRVLCCAAKFNKQDIVGYLLRLGITQKYLREAAINALQYSELTGTLSYIRMFLLF